MYILSPRKQWGDLTHFSFIGSLNAAVHAQQTKPT